MNVRHGTSLWAVLLTMTILTGAFAQPGENAQPPQGTSATAPIEYDSQQYLGQGVTLARLSNGMTVIVRENHAAPVATVRCYVTNTGGAYEGQYLGAGISHVLEHLVSGGSTEKRPEAEIQRLIDTMGGQSNAYTSNNVTAYHITCPSKQANLAIELVAESMQYAKFVSSEYEREMGVVQRELEMGETERGRQLYQAMKELIYQEHPMRFPTIGYLSVLQQVKREEIIDFYRNRYVPQNMIFVVVGDVKTSAVLDHVRQQFQNFPRTTDRAPVLKDEPPQASPRSRRFQMPGSTTHLSIAWPTVRLQDPDLYPLDVASYLLTSGESSRLVRRLRVEQPLAISVSSASYTPGDVAGWFEVTVECRPENLEQCRRIILEEIARLTRELVNSQELDKVKRQKAAEHVFSQQTVDAQAEALASSYQATGNPLFDDQYVEEIQKVTPEQVRAAARRYFRPERQNTVIIDPPGSAAEQQQEEQQEQVESPVVSRQLPNGLTVLVKRHSVVPMVSIQAFVKAGVLSDTPETAGRAALATEMMTKGTEKYTAEQIAEYFDSIGGALVAQSQRNSSFVQCSVLAQDFETSLDYVHQVLFRPTFPADEFEKAQQLQLGQIAAREANPQAQILDYWIDQLPNDAAYSQTVLGTQETVSRLSVDDCRKFHSQYFVPGNMVLAVYGDVDPEATMKRLETLFGGQSSGQASFPEFPVEALQLEGGRHELPGQQPDAAMVLVGYSVPSIYDEKAQAALEVLSGILTGGGGAGGRLFNELRGERLVYYVFGFQINGVAPGYYLFLAQTQPATVDDVIQRIEANLRRIEQEGIPEDEFELVRQKLMASHAISNTTPASQAFQASIDQLYGLGYDYDKGYDERIGRVTVADVQNVIRQHFQNPVIATVRPTMESAQ